MSYAEALARCEALGRAKSAAWEAWQWSMGCWDENQNREIYEALVARCARVQREVLRMEKRQPVSVWSTEEAA